MSEKRYVDRSYKAPENRPKPNSNSQNIFYILKSDKSKKYLRYSAVILLVSVNVGMVYAAMNYEIPKDHPYSGMFSKKNNPSK